MRKYRESFIIGLQQSLEYRFEFFINIISTLFPILIQIFLWYAIYDGTGQDTMYDYSFSQMLGYVTFAGVVSKFVVTGIENTVNDDIHSGGLSMFLIKTVKYIPFRLLQAIGQKFASTVTMLLFAAFSVLMLTLTVGFEIKLYAVCLFIPSLLLAMLMNFFIFFIVSISAFVLTEVGRFFHALQVVIMVASGGVFPISIFGNTYVTISRFLPFQYTSYFPTSVITGALTLTEIFLGMLIQCGWIVVLLTLSAVFWRAGLKKYTAVGG